MISRSTQHAQHKKFSRVTRYGRIGNAAAGLDAAPGTLREVSAPSDRDPVIDSLVQTSFTVVALLSQVAAAHDLSLTQLRVLAILRDHQPKIADLADHLGLERSSVSGLIDRAVKRGLVRRAPGGADGRVVHVLFTDAGRELADALGAEVAQLLAPLTHRLNPVERKRLDALLAKFLG